MDYVEFWEREVLPRLSVEAVYDVKWQTRGPRFWRGPCPLHGGSEANFSVDSHTLRWKCFSHCGGGSIFAFLNEGIEPRGSEWMAKLRALAEFAGVPFPSRDLAPEAQARLEENARRDALLEAYAAICARALLDPQNPDAQSARDYLKNRGFEPTSWPDLPLGQVPNEATLRAELEARGFASEEITASGVLRDSRFQGRLLIVWRDARGRIGTFAARALDAAPASEKYLYLSRENGWAQSKSDLVAFGLDGALPAIRQSGHLLLVEGLLDVLTLQNRGFAGVAAIGGGGREMSAERLAALRNLGARRVTVCLDNDPKPDGSWPGREGTSHIARLATLKNTRKGENGNVTDVTALVPVVDVISPFLLGSHKDADAYVRARGIDEWKELLEQRTSAAHFLGDELLADVSPQSSEAARRAALEQIFELDAECSGPRAPLDREELRALAAQKTGYSLSAIAQIAEEIALESESNRSRRALENWLRGAAREVQSLENEPQGLEPLLGRFAGDLAALRATGHSAPPPFSVARLDEESARQPDGKSSLWPSLDALGVRFGAGEFALVGARTGHGKTSFLVALLAQWLALENEETLLFFSLEEPELRIYHRLLALLAAQEARRTGSKSSVWTVPQVRDYGRDSTSRGPSFGWPDPELLNTAREKLRRAESRLQIVFQSGWSVDEMENFARLQARSRPIGAIFVDYLQRVPTPTGRFDRRDQEVSAVGRRFKTLAVDLGAPLIAGAQINREAIPEGFSKTMNAAKNYSEAVKTIRNARPELHHLREGGSEQEADLTLGLLSYGADYRGDSAAPFATKLEIGALKNRNGEPGKWATLAFEGRSGLVREFETDEEI